MRFFRSSDKPKTSRFSFRRHSEEAEQPPAPIAKPRKGSQPTPTASRPPVASAAFPSATPKGGSTSVSTSASSSVASDLPLDEVDEPRLRKSVRASDSRASTATDESETAMGTPLATPTATQRPPAVPAALGASARSLSSSSSGSGRHTRHSLVGFRQLECSMTYKNRMGSTHLAVPEDELAHSRPSTPSSFRDSELHLHHHHHHHHPPQHSAASSVASSGSYNSTTALSAALPISVTGVETPSGMRSSSNASLSTDGGRNSEQIRMTEASVAALQTRRAFQQMVLALEDEDSSDEDSDYYGSSRRSSTRAAFLRRSTGSSSGSASGSGGIVQLGADDYRKFQFRLRQLEDLCHEQGRKQAQMEETIEHEVETRTKRVVEAMEKKIAMYKQAKDLEVEREIQRRVAELIRHSGASSGGRSSHESASLPPQYPTAANGHSASASASPALKGKPLDKIFHPRRTRRRMELLREREEQQKREMEQFREFIRNTEARSTAIIRDDTDVATARASIKALGDPNITEDLLRASQNELVEMICMLRKHVNVQEEQLDEAKRLISAAIEAREDAEATAREAVELTMALDSRLERASQEIIVIRDELRRSSEYSMRSSGVMDRSSSYLSLRGLQNSSFVSTSSNIPNSPPL